jgi:hypothetical protein
LFLGNGGAGRQLEPLSNARPLSLADRRRLLALRLQLELDPLEHRVRVRPLLPGGREGGLDICSRVANTLVPMTVDRITTRMPSRRLLRVRRSAIA